MVGRDLAAAAERNQQAAGDVALRQAELAGLVRSTLTRSSGASTT